MKFIFTYIIFIQFLFSSCFSYAQITESQLLNKMVEVQQWEVYQSTQLLNNSEFTNSVVQIGNGNLAEIRGSGIELQQKGDSQQFFYDQFRIQSGQMQINMEGDGNSLIINGNNSIMDHVKINLQDNDRVIIINNFL